MPSREKSLAEVQQPKNDAYTVMLSISLVAMIAACVLLWQEVKRYPTLKPTAKDMQPPPVMVGPSGGGEKTEFQTPDVGGEKPPAGGGEPTKPDAGGAQPTKPGGNP